MDAALATSHPHATPLTRHLARARHLRLTTFRKSGQPVGSPVWFALVGDRAYVVSEDPSGKVKRLRHTSRVRLAPGDYRGRPTGDEIEATATIIADTAEEHTAERALRERYGWQWRLFRWFTATFRKRNGRPIRHVFLRLTTP
jgi:PPOX class probable F420-dependent enzyme